MTSTLVAVLPLRYFATASEACHKKRPKREATAAERNEENEGPNRLHFMEGRGETVRF